MPSGGEHLGNVVSPGNDFGRQQPGTAANPYGSGCGVQPAAGHASHMYGGPSYGGNLSATGMMQPNGNFHGGHFGASGQPLYGNAHLFGSRPAGDVSQSVGGSVVGGGGQPLDFSTSLSGSPAPGACGHVWPGSAMPAAAQPQPGFPPTFSYGSPYQVGVPPLGGSVPPGPQQHLAPGAALAPGVPEGDPQAPNCACGQPSLVLTVRKEGPNMGRVFFKCSKPQGEQCSYFQWADEPPRPASGSGPANPGQDTAGPACLCGHPSVTLTVRKEGPNTGRMFYKCPMPQGEQCGFFQWADEAPKQPGPPCQCGIPSAQRTVTKEGPNNGRPFMVCAKRACDFFQWGDEDPAAQGRPRGPPVASPARAGGCGGGGGGNRAMDTCYKCQGTGHWAQDCPNEPAVDAGGGGRKRGRGKGGGRGRGRRGRGRGADAEDADGGLDFAGFPGSGGFGSGGFDGGRFEPY